MPGIQKIDQTIISDTKLKEEHEELEESVLQNERDHLNLAYGQHNSIEHWGDARPTDDQSMIWWLINQ